MTDAATLPPDEALKPARDLAKANALRWRGDFERDAQWVVDGEEWARVFVWARDGETVRLFWAAEGGFETADPGFDPHLAPDPTPLWNLIDWTPEGRPKDWYPKLDY